MPYFDQFINAAERVVAGAEESAWKFEGARGYVALQVGFQYLFGAAQLDVAEFVNCGHAHAPQEGKLKEAEFIVVDTCEQDGVAWRGQAMLPGTGEDAGRVALPARQAALANHAK